MARTAQKNSVKGIRGPKKAAQCSYNGVALPTDMAERRRMRNKLSAKVHREKKKDVLESAKQEVVAYDKEMNQLKSELIEMRTKAIALQGIFESIEAKFGAEAVKNIFKKFGDVDVPMSVVDTYYPLPSAVSSDSDDTFTSDDDSTGCSQHCKNL
eukprot:scaffold6391_cov108-Skeletonema_marinoi.AAC.2